MKNKNIFYRIIRCKIYEINFYSVQQTHLRIHNSYTRSAYESHFCAHFALKCFCTLQLITVR